MELPALQAITFLVFSAIYVLLHNLKQLLCNNSVSREQSEKWLSQSAKIRIRQKNIYTINFKCYNNNKSQCCVCVRAGLCFQFSSFIPLKSVHSNNGVRVYSTFSIPIKYSFGVFWGVFTTCFLAFRSFFFFLQPLILSVPLCSHECAYDLCITMRMCVEISLFFFYLRLSGNVSTNSMLIIFVFKICNVP